MTYVEAFVAVIFSVSIELQVSCKLHIDGLGVDSFLYQSFSTGALII